MKKIIILTATLISSTIFFAQGGERESVEDHEIRKGFYGNLNINSISPFDETYNLGAGAGMHFSEQFHIGFTYFGGKGDTRRLFHDSLGLETGLKYNSFGIELGYEIPLHKHFSIMPYFNQSFVKYSYLNNIPDSKSKSASDNFLNTQIGAKLLFVANENIKIGANVNYGLANGVNLFNTKTDSFNGLSAGLVLQYNLFFPKW